MPMRDGIDVGRVARIGIGALAVLVLVVAGAMALTARWNDDRPPGTAWSPRSGISGPLLETRPQDDMARYLARKRESIERYGWIDRQAGIARIPIEDAMRAVAEGARP
ncbi:hypothetical protein [Bordetella bronchialis]|uniref:Uncharacterized protein n=1 Tax=Bordetella bronchialis TaxID=463025 RepID=A0A193FYU5_9BORD|nr:hypothetical protein [Bordetella bronchialis]ANN72361.1 hypothetical protein BAU08_14310 [Bordetella bronchialis]